LLHAHKKYISAVQQDVSHSKLWGCFLPKIQVTKNMFLEVNDDAESVVLLQDTSLNYTAEVARKRLKYHCCGSQNLTIK